ncbi:proline iminopeptidase [Chitinophaga eiseniae]|uniref:Proline iminopeptidase n=1 Tax=Chitinophaga eiseniae TaxID=634771 RepID=A0A1T4P024_9BACT|nr:alpha/beta hydrolase [Chitinophaga eiseniae]SJZ84722.1 proline iminopeptidase [Chitinophaga eiseniae]
MVLKNNLSVLSFAAVLLLTSCSTEDRTIDGVGNLVPRTVDQDANLPAIQANNARLHAEASGPANGTMVVVLHGGPGGDYRYLLPCKDLAQQGYRVVLYDQRGSGLSQRFPKKSYTAHGAGAMDVMYDDLSAVIAHYRTSPTQKVVLLGHSWGGILASGYAGKHPDNIQGVIACEAGGLKWDDIKAYVKDSRSFKLWGELLNDAAFLDQFITGKEDQHEVLDYKMSLLVSRNDITGEGTIDPSVSWRNGAVIMDALFDVGDTYHIDFSAGLDRFKKPVLFFHSENNKAYPDTWAKQITNAYPSVRLVKVPGVGHDGIITNHKAWTETTMPAILTYLRSLP